MQQEPDPFSLSTLREFQRGKHKELPHSLHILREETRAIQRWERGLQGHVLPRLSRSREKGARPQG